MTTFECSKAQIIFFFFWISREVGIKLLPPGQSIHLCTEEISMHKSITSELYQHITIIIIIYDRKQGVTKGSWVNVILPPIKLLAKRLLGVL